MQITDIFRAVPNSAGGVTLVLKRPIRTIDGRTRTTDPAHSQLAWKSNQQRGRFRDTMIYAESPAHNPGVFYNAWIGDLRAKLGLLSATDRAKALDAMRRVLDDEVVRAGDPEEGTGAADELNVGAGADPQDVNDANKKFWDAMAKNNTVTRDSAPPRDATQAAIQNMQRANDSYWAQQTAHQHRPEREWGKG
jgi:hypothetical protein